MFPRGYPCRFGDSFRVALGQLRGTFLLDFRDKNYSCRGTPSSVLGGATIKGKETHHRNHRSQLRVAMFHVYGGSDWVNFLLALGGDGINEDLIKCYNDENNVARTWQ